MGIMLKGTTTLATIDKLQSTPDASGGTTRESVCRNTHYADAQWLCIQWAPLDSAR